ncbi:MAG: hypothetical protein ACRD9S_11835 [Pyrinomonadaceae bacterium]
MLPRSVILLASIFFFTPGCSSTPGAAAPPATSTPSASSATASEAKIPNVAACTALSNEEILAVQGETVTETKGNDSTGRGLAVSHCVYLLPTYSKSLSLDITKAASSTAGDDVIEKFWETRFEGSEKEREHERERDAEKAREARTPHVEGRPRSREREEEEMESKPRRVAGVGDEAFWVGSGVKGALYVRKGDAVFILSIGGAEPEAIRIKKTTVLAQHALKRIQ